MRVAQKVLDQIKGSVRTKNRLALELNRSVATITRWIEDPEKYDDLTKAAALKVISEETGLSNEEILEETASVS